MADLPSGAVTFVFTDIEGSTRLVRQLRGRYAEALAEHQRLVRAAFTGHGGHEIDTQGDAFFYAFGSAHEAVLAAVEAQRALSGHPWPDESELKVRIGVHTGPAEPADGRYTGLAVHRAARICAAGHGGQILVSQATQSLIEDEEEHLAVSLRDLGDQRLKDIDRPVRLYQVVAPGLATDFPPLRGEADEPHAAPRPVWRRRRTSSSPSSLCSPRSLQPCSWRRAKRQRAERRPSEPRRPDRSEDERDRRRDPGRRPARPAGGRRWGGLGREPRRAHADEDRRRRGGSRRNVSARQPDADRRRRRRGVGLGRPRGARKALGGRPRVRAGEEDDRRRPARRSGRRTARSPSAPAPSGRCSATRRLRASIRDSRGHRAGADGERARRESSSPNGYVWVVNSDSANGAALRSGDVRGGTDRDADQRRPAADRNRRRRGGDLGREHRVGHRHPHRRRQRGLGRRPRRRSRSATARSPWRSARARSGSRTPATEPSRASTPPAQEVVKTIEVGNAPSGIAVRRGCGLGLGPVALS